MRSFFKEFNRHENFVKSLNETFFVLIQNDKNKGAEDLRDFRSISLVDSLYKWLGKELANKLIRVIGKVVSKAQNAFMEGRQILDASIITNETIDSISKSDDCGILCKFGIKKAYDKINWSFLLLVLQNMSFGEKWIGWMKRCISIASFSILVNGTLVGFFQSFKGLRERDPLSPYLFVVVIEALNFLLKKAINGFFFTFQLRGRDGEGVKISHILFTNYTRLL